MKAYYSLLLLGAAVLAIPTKKRAAPLDCQNLTVAGLKKVNLTNPDPACLAVIPKTTLQRLPLENLNQLFDSNNVLKWKFDGDLLKTLLSKVNSTKVSKAAVSKWWSQIFGDQKKLDELFEMAKDLPALQARFLDPSIEGSFMLCSRIDARIMPVLGKGFFSKVSPRCLRSIPPASFAKISAGQLDSLNKAALGELQAAQAEAMPENSFVLLRPQLAAHFGPKIFPIRGEPKQAAEDRRAGTPCTVFTRVKGSLRGATLKALGEHCGYKVIQAKGGNVEVESIFNDKDDGKK